MNKPYDKILLLCVNKYSLYNSFLEILKEISNDVKGFDIRGEIGKLNLNIQTQMFRLPFSIRKQWETYFLKKANNILLTEIRKYKPELVFVYNSEYLLPETCASIKQESKLIFFMGDSPFYSHINNYYLHCLTYADLILVPDSFWIEQLNIAGISKTAYFIAGIDNNSYYPVNHSKEFVHISETDILYTGASYVNSWGYKKAILMNQFTGLNFKLYGNSAWERWFRFFPDLEHVFNLSDYIPTTILNQMFNKTKLIPVDGNPAILNGFHLRLFEALGAGALPLVEYRKDVEEILFKECGVMVPLIKNYKKAGEMAEYFLKNEKERLQLAQTLRNYVLTKYNPKTNSDKLLEYLQ